MKNQLVITRPAMVSDFLQYERIEEGCFPRPWTCSQFQELACRMDLQFFSAVLRANPFRVVGYALLRSAVPTVEEYPEEFLLKRIAVEHRFQRQGIARDMITYIVKKFCQPMLTEVCETNLPALSLLRSCGWRAFETLKDHHRADGQIRDAIVLELTLAKSKIPSAPARKGKRDRH